MLRFGKLLATVHLLLLLSSSADNAPESPSRQPDHRSSHSAGQLEAAAEEDCEAASLLQRHEDSTVAVRSLQAGQRRGSSSGSGSSSAAAPSSATLGGEARRGSIADSPQPPPGQAARNQVQQKDLSAGTSAASGSSSATSTAATGAPAAAAPQGRTSYGAAPGMGMGRMGMLAGGGFSLSMLFMIILMGLSGGILSAGSTCFWGITNFFGSFFVAEVDIECRSEAHKWLEFWLSQCEELEERASRFRMALSRELGPQHASSNRAARLCEAAEAAHKTNQPCFLPRDGESTRINFEGWWLWIKMGVTKESGQQQQGGGFAGMPGGPGNEEKAIRITAPFRNKAKIVQLLETASKLYQDRLKTHTMIWTVAGGGGRGRWRVLDARPSRPLDTVILEDGCAGFICEDVQRFLKGESWYCARGVPYRRGYLLYGPPGCGKTSFITALAGELHLVICIINLSSKELTDESLLELLAEAPRHSILLLEDVDAAFRRDGPPQETPPEMHVAQPNGPFQMQPPRGMAARRQGEAVGVTFSGVLNAIDGVAAQEGKVLFLTTNHPDRLDEALVRPGRVDVRIQLGLASVETARRLFLRFYKETPIAALEGEQAGATLEELAAEFAKQLPDKQVSPATIQGLLMDFRDNPHDAVRNAWRIVPRPPHEMYPPQEEQQHQQQQQQQQQQQPPPLHFLQQQLESAVKPEDNTAKTLAAAEELAAKKPAVGTKRTPEEQLAAAAKKTDAGAVVDCAPEVSYERAPEIGCDDSTPGR
eukprot:TRINITY_DN4221_c0_g2_i3.p1 TRINITY_DN4221_c0_g2~~TRINITY_DN4221_c0_g2_i3.p1  ORF type:complete len:763 (-),score=163.32 TRINITY_DN4221_c0_g2_i3:23-2311(-)